VRRFANVALASLAAVICFFASAPARADIAEELTRIAHTEVRLLPAATHADSRQSCAELAIDDQPPPAQLIHANWAEVDDLLRSWRIMLWAVVLPHPGFTWRDDAPGFVLSWPGSGPFGPVTACTRTGGGFHEHQPFRFVFEPGLVVTDEVSLFVRPGLRYLWHRSTSSFGWGIGVGSTLEWTNMDRFSASVSPELLAQYGKCCSPGYTMVAVRLDEFILRSEGTAITAITANVGLTYW